jgi:hypothetical protein
MCGKLCKACQTCRTPKKNNKNYAKISPPKKEPESVAWHTLCVDLIGPKGREQECQHLYNAMVFDDDQPSHMMVLDHRDPYQASQLHSLPP